MLTRFADSPSTWVVRAHENHCLVGCDVTRIAKLGALIAFQSSKTGQEV